MTHFKKSIPAIIFLTFILFSCKKDTKPEELVMPKAVEIINSISQSFVGKDSLSQFAAQFKTVLLTDEEVKNGITVFAPTNKAYNLKTNFIKGSSIQADDYLPDSSTVKDYIVSGKVEANTMVEGFVMTTLSGKKITVAKKGSTFWLGGRLFDPISWPQNNTSYSIYTTSELIRAILLPQITAYERDQFPGWLLTISGLNFSTTAINNLVKIDGIPAIVHKASANELVVSVPKGVTDGVLSITTNGRTVIGATKLKIMKAEVTSIPGTMHDIVQSIAVDSEDNLYWTENIYNSTTKAYIARIARYADGLTNYYMPSVDGVSMQGLPYGLWTIAVDKQKNIYFSNSFTGGTGANVGLFRFNTNFPNNGEWWAKNEVPLTYATVFDKDDNLMVWTGDALKKISSNGGTVSTVLNLAAFKAVDPTITSLSVFGISWFSSSFYISDYKNRRLWINNENGLKIVAGNGGLKLAKDGIGLDAQFAAPFGITTDKKGNIYVCDNDYVNNSFLVRMVNPYGVVTTIAGSGKGLVDGIGLNASFQGINGIAIDSKGVLYIGSDTGLIRKITIK